MIEINLVPPQQRKKRRTSLLPKGFSIPAEVVIGASGALIMLLVVVHVLFLIINTGKLARYRALQAEWTTLTPEKQRVDAVIGRMRELQSKEKALAELLKTQDTVSWAEVLNAISDTVPRGVWLRKVALGEAAFLIEGSAISQQNINEMTNVHTFTANLKNDALFMKHLSDLELGSIQRRKIEKNDVAEFLITTQLKK